MRDIGIDDIAWKADDVFDFIKYCNDNDIVILGIDVLKKLNNTYTYTYDSWYTEKINNQIAEKYLLNYIDRNKLVKEDLLFTVVICERAEWLITHSCDEFQ